MATFDESASARQPVEASGPAAQGILELKRTHFVLWRPGATLEAPKLIIGQRTGNDRGDVWLNQVQVVALRPLTEERDLWGVAAAGLGLRDQTTYGYWFEVTRRNPRHQEGSERLLCTDPTAWAVDRRMFAPPGAGGTSALYPCSVVRYEGGRLIPCDAGGQVACWDGEPLPDSLPTNNQVVIYELPTRWVNQDDRGVSVEASTFQDVVALLVRSQESPNFTAIPAVNNRAILVELGINALELLPPADSDQKDTWGYGTSNYFAPSYWLGRSRYQEDSTSVQDLSRLVCTCHRKGIRFFADSVLAFAQHPSYCDINFADFFVEAGTGDPEQAGRDGFGGDLFKYGTFVRGWDPIDGQARDMVPARQFMKAYLLHWMEHYHLDGLRLDNLDHVANRDFVGEFTSVAREAWRRRWQRTTGHEADQEADARFLVVGEEPSAPPGMLEQRPLDALWNETFKRMIRAAVLGCGTPEEPRFEWCVRKLVDCRLLGFADGTQAVNYLTSHHVGGQGNERFYEWLRHHGVVAVEERVKLAFCCLMTAVGIPMILAGEEFADEHDRPTGDHGKLIDPVNYRRLQDPWRERIFKHVSRLVRLRTSSPALAGSQVEFIHSDLEDGRRVMAWVRGTSPNLVVVVANFSDWGTPHAHLPNAEYPVPGWPETPPGRHWFEVTAQREVPQEWVGREPIYPWEAKVYELRT